MISIFLSHNKENKPFVRRLARDLESQGIKCWVDEAEIKVGESLIYKIREGIDNYDYFAIILSPHSVKSTWVQYELDAAMNLEIIEGLNLNAGSRKVKVLPLMYKSCEPLGFLLGKKFADFTNDANYNSQLEELVRSVGVVFNKSALNSTAEHNIFKALHHANTVGLPIFAKPFHRPFQYLGMTVQQAVDATGHQPNKQGGNIIIDTDACHMCLTVEGNFIVFVEVDIHQTAPHYQNQNFDPLPILGALSINPAELDFVQGKTHYHYFDDHSRKLRVSVSCLYDEAPISVGFGKKYYGTFL
jgi:hypothetical protein